MQRKKLTLPMFLIVLVIFLINAGLSTSKLINLGATTPRIIPVVCWFLASIFWTVIYIKTRDRSQE